MRFFNVENSLDYYPFGMLMPERNGGANYRYSFQGQEADNEVKGKGNSVNYKYRMHDARLGRFFAVDPLTSKYPHYTPYSFSGNKVIHAVELEGLEEWEVNGTMGSKATINGPFKNQEEAQEYSKKNFNSINWVLPEITISTNKTSIQINAEEVRFNFQVTRGEEQYKSAKAELLETYSGIFSSYPVSGVHFVFEKITPTIYKNTVRYLDAKPEWALLTYNGGGKAADRNRKIAVKQCLICPPDKNSRDEFPYASTTQGGLPAMCDCVPPLENSIQGGMLYWGTFKSLNVGDNFLVVPVDEYGIPLVPSMYAIPKNRYTPKLDPRFHETEPYPYKIQPKGGPVIIPIWELLPILIRL